MSIIKKGTKKALVNSLKLGFFARSGLYQLESSPIIRMENWIRHKKFQPQEQIISEAELLKEVQSLIDEDIKNFIELELPFSILNVENPIKHAKNLLKIYIDSIDVAYNKKFKKNKIFSESSRLKSEKLPDYYKRNFHNQTDGYLSEDSAKMYEHQVEILFRGTADMMRRLIIPQILNHYHKTDDINIIDVGAGTGISTKLLSCIFKNSNINAFDLSKDYIEYAEKNHTFKNTTYSFANGENLKCLKSESNDLWVSTFMFHELPHKARIKCLDEAYRVLKPGGMIAVVDSIQNHDREDFKEILSAFPQNFHEPYYKNYTLNPLEKDFEQANFKNIKSSHNFLSKVVTAIK